MKAMVPIMYEFAMKELHALCQGDAALRRRRKQQLGLFLVTLEELVRPVTIDDEGVASDTDEAVMNDSTTQSTTERTPAD